MTWDKYLISETAGAIYLGILIFACGFMVVRVLNHPPPDPKPPTPETPAKAVRVKENLPALHLLSDTDLYATAFEKEEERQKELAKYVGRRLLTALKKGDAVTDAAAATAAVTTILGKKPVTASLPATPATTLGGRLKVGDVVELASVGAGDGARGAVNQAPGLVVIGLPAEVQAADKTKGEVAAPPGAVVVAFDGANLELFMRAVGGESLVLVRPNAGANQ